MRAVTVCSCNPWSDGDLTKAISSKGDCRHLLPWEGQQCTYDFSPPNITKNYLIFYFRLDSFYGFYYILSGYKKQNRFTITMIALGNKRDHFVKCFMSVCIYVCGKRKCVLAQTMGWSSGRERAV